MTADDDASTDRFTGDHLSEAQQKDDTLLYCVHLQPCSCCITNHIDVIYTSSHLKQVAVHNALYDFLHI